MGGDEAFEVVRREHYALALLAAANIDVPNVAGPDVGAQRLHGHAEAARGLGGGQEQGLGVGHHRLAAALRARQGGERKGRLHRVAIVQSRSPSAPAAARSCGSGKSRAGRRIAASLPARRDPDRQPPVEVNCRARERQSLHCSRRWRRWLRPWWIGCDHAALHPQDLHLSESSRPKATGTASGMVAMEPGEGQVSGRDGISEQLPCPPWSRPQPASRG